MLRIFINQIFEKPDQDYLNWRFSQNIQSLINGLVFTFLSITALSVSNYFYYIDEIYAPGSSQIEEYNWLTAKKSIRCTGIRSWATWCHAAAASDTHRAPTPALVQAQTNDPSWQIDRFAFVFSSFNRVSHLKMLFSGNACRWRTSDQ